MEPHGTPVGFAAVDLAEGFWKEKQELVRANTIDAVYHRFEETGRLASLAGSWKEGEPLKPHIFWESDITKWIEGAACFLKKERDPALEEKIDALIHQMEQYQDKDGYLNVYFTVVEPDTRFTRRMDHELYCAGHLIEGAIAYYEATGKRKLLDIAIRYADRIYQVFFTEHSAAFDTPGHEEIELALVKLYRATRDCRYRELAGYFIDTRGTSSRERSAHEAEDVVIQSHLPVRSQKTAEGHAVRALYLYCGMADLALLNQDGELAEACQELFTNITTKRMHITGGVGSTHLGETFTYDYDLPEYTTYNETCASIALALFCRRMWLLRPNRMYADCAEAALYNTVLSGLSLSGDQFFYENPIAADPARDTFFRSRPQYLREHLPLLERVKIFDCSCCPPNLIRAIGSIGDYMYSVRENTIYAQCYMSGDARILLPGQEISLKQRTAYPYDGSIRIETKTAGTYTLALRIPGWCRSYTITVCGEEVPAEAREGFVCLQRCWEAGDTLCLVLDMPVERIEANPMVKNLCGRVAITRGPLVYCAEGIDNETVPLRDVKVGPDAEIRVGEDVIVGTAFPVLTVRAERRSPFSQLYRPSGEAWEECSLRLIPYFAWANRGACEMNLWFLA